MKNKNNIVFRFAAMILCIVMMISLVACNSVKVEVEDAVIEETVSDREDAVVNDDNKGVLSVQQQITPLNDTVSSTTNSKIETMKVVVFTANVYKGNRVVASSLTLQDVPVTDLPFDPITSIDDIVGKYFLKNGSKGECVTASMISNIDPYINMTGLGEDYVIISNIINENREETDMSVVIQKAIDENPGKTIYFPDGKYNLTKTLIIPAEEDKSVSFRLSNYATFGPATNWDSSCTALIQFGKPENEKTQPAAHSAYIMGGAFDCNGSLTAIDIYGGGRLFVNNVSIENSKIGIQLRPNAAYNNLEDINITAKNTNGTRGLFVEGTNNSLINMRIYRVQRGVHLTGGDNVLVNIHPLFSGTNSTSAIGFHDESTGNRYNICYSDQYMIGFKMSAKTRSYFDTCYVYWWAGISYEIGFLCEGEFNSVITDSFVNFQNVKDDSQCHYIYFVEEPSQKVEETEKETQWPDNEPRPTEDIAEDGTTVPSDRSQDSSSSTSQNNGPFATIAPAGSGKIVNMKISSSQNSDSNYYQQFEYSYK